MKKILIGVMLLALVGCDTWPEEQPGVEYRIQTDEYIYYAIGTPVKKDDCLTFKAAQYGDRSPVEMTVCGTYEVKKL